MSTRHFLAIVIAMLAARPAYASEAVRGVLDTYCVACHNDRAKTAGLNLANVDLANVGQHVEILEKVLRRLEHGSMPPVGNRRPPPEAYSTTIAWLRGTLDRHAALRPNVGGAEVMHRLNRAEYQNAIRDLLGIEGMNIEDMLPADDASYGFDNIAGILGISPTHLDRYLVAARKISRAALGEVLLPDGITRIVPVDFSQDARVDGAPIGTRGGIVVKRYFPVDGEYVVRFQTVTGYGVSKDEPNFVEVTVDGERAFYAPVRQPAPADFEAEASAAYEVHLPVKGGLHAVAIVFTPAALVLAEDYLQPYLLPPSFSVYKNARMGGYAGPYVSLFSITGPFNVSGPGETPSRKRILVCQPATTADEWSCARRIATSLARRAYRRPPTRAEIADLLGFYSQARSSGHPFEHGIRVVLQRILASPDFLFRITLSARDAKPGVPYRLSAVDLASRLSFFLWSSIPDDELLDLASTSRLHDTAVLMQQVKRMLADPKAEAFVTNFAGQWLRLRNAPAAQRDTRLFPDFDENLRRAFVRETELFVGSIVSDDRSVLDLIRANYSFLNERLARHYGVSNVYGNEFRRVAFSDERRGGLLGQGSILTVTSQPNRTSPVIRGKWILENLLGAPPPSPPADVPPLEATTVTGTLRQRTELHRRNPVCASCHKSMDPLGFALENYDAVGAWRTHEGAAPVDAMGSMPDGTTFDGVSGLRAALLARPEIFVTALTEKLLVYALGRGVEFSDAPAVRRIVQSAAAQQYRFSSLILGIVNSPLFQMRQVGALPAAARAGG